MRLPLLLSASAVSMLVLSAPTFAQSKIEPGPTPVSLRQLAHQSPDWQLIKPHLPDPATAPAATLEMQGDLLRVRRFPDDALDYYNYAVQRGGDQAQLFNKIGVTQMELGNTSVARAYFQHVLKLRKKDPQAWNNMGAVEFMNHNYGGAVICYKRAIRLNKKFAVSHSNLGLAYIEQKDFASAKDELTLALKLDPHIFEQNSAAGVSLHTMSASDRANFCFQMAKVYARAHDEAEMLHELQTASEAGMDVRYEMSSDHDLAPYTNDPRVVELVLVAKSLREGRLTRTVASALPPAQAVPALPAASTEVHR